jgi:DNA repair exonuclease SbcCD ATPase subunit
MDEQQRSQSFVAELEGRFADLVRLKGESDEKASKLEARLLAVHEAFEEVSRKCDLLAVENERLETKKANLKSIVGELTTLVDKQSMEMKRITQKGKHDKNALRLHIDELSRLLDNEQARQRSVQHLLDERVSQIDELQAQVRSLLIGTKDSTDKRIADLQIALATKDKILTDNMDLINNLRQRIVEIETRHLNVCDSLKQQLYDANEEVREAEERLDFLETELQRVKVEGSQKPSSEDAIPRLTEQLAKMEDSLYTREKVEAGLRQEINALRQEHQHERARCEEQKKLVSELLLEKECITDKMSCAEADRRSLKDSWESQQVH